MKIRKSHILDLAQVLAVIAVLATALFVSGRLRAGDRQERSDASSLELPVVSLVADQRLDHAPIISTTGVVVSRTSTQVAARVSGQVVSVSENFRAGANVRAGDVLFSIDREDYLLAVERANASIANARASLTRLEAEADSARKEWTQLYPGRPITPLAAMVPQLRAAEAQLSSAQATARSAQLSLERTQVFAAVDAHVVSTELDVGQIVSAGVPVGVLQPVDAMEIEASLSVSELAAVSPVSGRACILRFRGRSAQQEQIAGRVVRVAPRLDPRTRLALIYIAMQGRQAARVGEFADIEVIGETVRDAVRLPQTALSGISDVWVVEGDELGLRQVMILEREPDLIVAPFEAADGVVAVPPYGAHEQMRVRVLDGTAGRVDVSGN